jgi:hypothetical protein
MSHHLDRQRGTGDNAAMAMSEQEWLACSDPTPMLEFLGSSPTVDLGNVQFRGWVPVNDRKLRLFAVACCRRIWPLLTSKSEGLSRPLLLDHERRVIEEAEQSLVIAEKYAEGIGDTTAVRRAYCDIIGLLSRRRPRQEPWAFALLGVLRATDTGGYYYGQQGEYQHYDACRSARDAADHAARVTGWATKETSGFETIHRAEATLLRCILGNPFRPVVINPAWETSNVTALAQSIYDDRAFDRLPILADALEDAGCDNADILNHCRQPGEHVRGCWVVDLVLGKS